MMAVCLVMLLAPNVQAACRVNAGVVPQNIEINVGRVLIQPSLPIGSRITLLTYNLNPVINAGSCDFFGGMSYAHFTRSMTAVSGMDHVYQTDVPGVGIRLYGEASTPSGGDTVRSYYPSDVSRPYSIISLGSGFLQVELIKTAATTGSGPVASNGQFTNAYFDGSGPGRPLLTSSFSGLGITIVTSTCEVDTGSKNIAVNFGAVPSNTFSGLGSKGPNRDFAINLICAGGNVAGADQALISVRIDATQDSSNLPGVLAITSANDAASKVGIELVDLVTGNERQIVFGQGITLGRTSINASSTLSLPLRARYIQTQAGKVGAGEANGTATFTIEYQ
ncbi:type 1 fimbrial protein [Xylella taiwanensis]|uniref:Type 1 fimbrial protein n=2 Tax=Xylella taiwanensis TaxID=1444770 RepID=A0ABS8TS77_9GAMM|nr:fimbrial protein [Xylella taiwanensis]MCD8455521.1 type 1 fimbrial protein [Xylella taiwanensis]MCD8457929.1 type 1 fimbrial protein [Xylella taiwanensis]MCD8460063.1 type 1 fimbrial protein [Xylella taiwanensis]MCD8463878.1 type 1 fimbrial protein [Xylella taiwanensis]MCD8464567.1 type 1 fimbrial protein [Xylella taiwanensis]